MTTRYAWWQRIWIYQAERFPVGRFGILTFSFSFCSICISRLLVGDIGLPSFAAALVAFVCTFLFFLQLRFLDEFKDFETDCQFRPERPVPRGLVTLRQIGWALGLTFVIQFVLVFWFNPRLLVILIAVWGYMALMTVEFFVADWIKPRLLVYMWTHMLIMPIIDLFATGSDWMSRGWLPPAGLLFFLLVSFLNGLLVELGRKTWAPSQEKQGVDSYSSYCGLARALRLFQIVMALSFACILVVAHQVDFFVPTLVMMGVLLFTGFQITRRFSALPDVKQAKKLENFSGLWVVLSYLTLGIVPMGYAIWTL